MTNTYINKSVMRRVYLIWAYRLMVNKFTAKIAALGILAWGLTMYVVIESVMTNASRLSGFDYAAYYWNAFLGTGFFVETILVAAVLIAALIVLDTLSNIKNVTFAIFRRV
ncbi:MAG: hypothetical protein HZA95_02430 [Candidatus Vogelbacteria bacterium]|nr:hypothetical protein [Candidatus Vogelbacteria bacterium]